MDGIITWIAIILTIGVLFYGILTTVAVEYIVEGGQVTCTTPSIPKPLTKRDSSWKSF